jgi:hypothetical protein
MKYIKIKFTLGLDCEAYQVVDNMVVVGYIDLQGNPLELPEVTESQVLTGELLDYYEGQVVIPEITEEIIPQEEVITEPETI